VRLIRPFVFDAASDVGDCELPELLPFSQENRDLAFKIAGQVVIFQQHRLSLGLRCLWRTAVWSQADASSASWIVSATSSARMFVQCFEAVMGRL